MSTGPQRRMLADTSVVIAPSAGTDYAEAVAVSVLTIAEL
ncbi:hypothetical protein JOF36_007647 [Pseudonocardia parietis]|uniref:Type II toxin-antitoxin system VapC family toxin n=1 Tax=Pseudonocardia parietis TaxID=570936 RepID=A0ABS4W8B3_9PSEU|nr:hypothetical protein [Pseudonocardia parietis]